MELNDPTMMKLLELKGKDQKVFFVQIGVKNKIYFEKEDEAIALYKAFGKLKPIELHQESLYDWEFKNLKETKNFTYKEFGIIILGQETIELWPNKEETEKAREKFAKHLKKK